MTIERAAKVLKDIGETIWEPTHEEQARAVLDAIAEPTEEMVIAGGEAYKNMTGPATDLDVAEVIWRAMHHAMMKETP